jgi:hypothetical protein
MRKLEEGKRVPLRCTERRRTGKQWKLLVSLWLHEIRYTLDVGSNTILVAVVLRSSEYCSCAGDALLLVVS